MPSNPERSSRGGDVEGQTMIDTQWSVGKSISVSKASFDPGYNAGAIENTLSDGGTKISKADLVTGYCSYGKAIGER